VPGVAFEEGITSSGKGESVDDLRLREAGRNSASKPFNAATPLVVFSVIAAVVALGLGIPRLRAKDAPPTLT